MAKYRISLSVTIDDITDDHRAESERLLGLSLIDAATELTEISVWRRIGPLLVASGLLDDSYTDNFTEYCRVVAWINRLVIDIRDNGEIYKSQTRNGYQEKSRPQVAQLNELRRQLRGYVSDFGLSPSARKALEVVQRDLLDEFGDHENPYATDDAAYQAAEGANTRH